jgi:hypothetical protein
MKTLCNCLLIAVMLAISADLAFAQGKKGAAPAGGAAQPAAPAASSSAAIEAQMLAYGALDHIASAIAAEVCAKIPQPKDGTAASPGVPASPAVPTSTVVIYDQASFATLQSYESFIANAKAIVSLYETLLSRADHNALNKQLKEAANAEHPDRPAPHALGLSGTIDPFADATALLSAIAVSSNAETPGAIVIPDSALAVAVTRELTKSSVCAPKKPNVIYPPLFGNSSSTDFSSADIQSDLQKVHDVREFVIHRVSAENTQWIDDHKTPPNPNGNPVLMAALNDVNVMYDSFMNSLLQVNSATGAVGSASVIQGYQLANVLAGPAELNGSFRHPAFILLASILSAGGTVLDHKTFWTALSSGDKITYSGGVIANVSLWHSDAAVPLYSDLLRYRVPFSDVQKPSNVDNVTIGDNLH